MKHNYALEESITTGLRYIIEHQHDDGHWEDFQLPPGRSDMWVTAYIGLKLKEISERLNLTGFKLQLDKAAVWLEQKRCGGVGWGYNESCAPDADSTSFVLLFLSAMKRDIPDKDIHSLVNFVADDGGVRTYNIQDPTDFWGISHPDVTPVAGLAFLRLLPNNRSILNGIRKYVTVNQNENGSWNSYWWNTFLYSTNQNLSFLVESGYPAKLDILRDTVLSAKCNSPFQTALCLNCRRLLSIPADGIPEILTEGQQQSGSWTSIPMLRVTYSSMAEPWLLEDSGKLYRDENELYTTITILDSLAYYCV